MPTNLTPSSDCRVLKVWFTRLASEEFKTVSKANEPPFVRRLVKHIARDRDVVDDQDRDRSRARVNATRLVGASWCVAGLSMDFPAPNGSILLA
jgi:hypothetical protein